MEYFKNDNSYNGQVYQNINYISQQGMVNNTQT